MVKFVMDFSEQSWTVAPAGPEGRPDWSREVPARVPGAIVDDLHRANQVPDPYFAENFREVAWVGETTFWYRLGVHLDSLAEFVPANKGDRLVLQFDGIDTYGEIFWNGTSLGGVDNQFVRHRLTVQVFENGSGGDADPPVGGGGHPGGSDACPDPDCHQMEDCRPEQLRHRFFLEPAMIRPGLNELLVRIDPVKQAFRKWFDGVAPDTVGEQAMFDADRPWIRKSQMTFGWDNCPCLLSGGITLPVRLFLEPATRLADTQWKVTGLDRENARCTLHLKGALVGAPEAARIRISGRCLDSEWEAVATADADAGGCWQAEAVVERAYFWWPNGHGYPHLYDVSLRAEDAAGSLLAEETLRIGLRTARVVTGPPVPRRVDYRIGLPDGQSLSGASTMDGGCIGPWQRTLLASPEEVDVRPFAFEINGKRIFIKGFDWQAPDVLVGRIRDEHIERIVDLVVESGSNMLRAWGGGAVERESFYRLCDERGLLLWQDFFFACAVYPRDPAFLRRIEPEVEDIIRRLRNHTCLVIWCGDNESDMIEHDQGRDPDANPINKNLIPSALARLDWQERHYHSSSPSGGPYPRSDFGGDKRNWGPNFPHDNYRHIRQESARFISESGMKSFPGMEAIARTIPENLRWPLDNSTWHLHWGDVDTTVRKDYLLDDECVKFFGKAENLEERIRLSQFAQAYGTRLLIEQCRRRKPECGGILIWKTSDQWPGCDQGMVDSLGILRPVFHAIRHAFSGILVSISQGFGETGDAVQWWLTSDLDSPLRGTFTGAVYSLATSTTRQLVGQDVCLAADESRMVFERPIGEIAPADEILLAGFRCASPASGEELERASWYALDPRTAFRYHEHLQTRHREKEVLT